ncbi:MAG: PH domain-containing protein [Eubacteriales bacterium]
MGKILELEVDEKILDKTRGELFYYLHFRRLEGKFIFTNKRIFHKATIGGGVNEIYYDDIEAMEKRGIFGLSIAVKSDQTSHYTLRIWKAKQRMELIQGHINKNI